ncbi:MAG: hypothetical protein J6K32_10280 [Clostridia bacterium]|nr:hypothetical protein [Clostridia bacterium]
MTTTTETARETAQALQRVRAQAMLVERLSEQLRASGYEVCAIRTDGEEIRARGGVPQGLDARLIRAEALQHALQRECAVLRRLESEARGRMDGMRPELYAFCVMYYIGGMSLMETVETLGRSERQCRRYRREVQGYDE